MSSAKTLIKHGVLQGDLDAAGFQIINLGQIIVVDPLALLRANNLSDLLNVPVARNNLGLGALATLSSTAAGQAIVNLNYAASDSVLTSRSVGDSDFIAWRTYAELFSDFGAGPPFADIVNLVKSSLDGTKLFRFNLSGFTSGASRVLTPPDYNGTIATLAGTETLTNKKLGSLTSNGFIRTSGGDGTLSVVDPIPVDLGGTGAKTYTDGQLLIGKTAGNTLVKGSLTSISGRLTVVNGGGTIDLDLPQDIHPNSIPTFAGLILSSGSDIAITGTSFFNVGKTAGVQTGSYLLLQSGLYASIVDRSNDFAASLNTSLLTIDRDFKFPNANGTFALTNQLLDDTTLVHKTGNETIAGIKQFTSKPSVPIASFPRVDVDYTDQTLSSVTIGSSSSLTPGVAYTGAISAARTITWQRTPLVTDPPTILRVTISNAPITLTIPTSVRGNGTVTSLVIPNNGYHELSWVRDLNGNDDLLDDVLDAITGWTGGSNVTTVRSFNANATTLDEVADVLGTFIADMKAAGYLHT